MLQRLGLLASLGPFAAGVLVACSSAPSPQPAPSNDAGSFDAARSECTAGESTPCYCADGTFGTTVCSEAGTGFGACLGCEDASASPDDAGGGGSDASTPPHDAGSEKDASDGSASTLPPASFAFVHAAPGVPPIRLCLGGAAAGGASSVLPIPPLPDAPSAAPSVPAIGSYPAVAQGTPGFYPGSLGTLPFQSDLSQQTFQVYLVLSSSVSGDVNADGGLGTGPDGGPEETCTALVGAAGLGTDDTPPGRLVAGTDFFPLSAVAPGTFGPTGTYLLALTGCLPGAALGASTCGPSGTAGAAIGVAKLDTTGVAPGDFGAQFADRSSALEGTAFGGHAAATDGVEPVLVSSSGTATPLVAAEAPATFSASGVDPSTAAASTTDPATQDEAFGVLLAPADGGTPSTQPYPTGDLFSMPLSTIQTLSDWTASTASGATAFATGYAYTFVLVGDPSAPPVSSASYDGRGLHFIAFPNVFTFKSN